MKIIGGKLVAFNDVTKKPIASIELRTAVGVLDDQDPEADTATLRKRRDSEAMFQVERSFRLLFPDDEEILFFADTDEEKSRWYVYHLRPFQTQLLRLHS